MRDMPWDEPLARTLTLKSGECLTTLREPAEVFTRYFDKAPRWTVLDCSMETMIRAAERGGQNDIREATRLIAFVLRQRSLL